MSLSANNVPLYAAVGSVVGALAVYQNGVAISGATFLIDDDQSDFAIAGSNLTLRTKLPSAGFYDVKIDAAAAGVIVDSAEFSINVVAVSPDLTSITGGKGSVLSPQGTWTFGGQFHPLAPRTERGWVSAGCARRKELRETNRIPRFGREF